VSSPSRIGSLLTKGSFWRMREEASSAALLLGLGVLLLVAALSLYLSWQTANRNALASEANEVRVASLELLNAVRAEEIAAKNFIIAGDEASLTEHARAEAVLDNRLADIATLATRSKRYLAIVDVLRDRLAGRAQRFQEAVTGRRASGIDFAYNVAFNRANEASLDEVERLLTEIAGSATIKQELNLNDSESGRWWLAVGSLASFLLSAALCVGALFGLRRRVNLLKASERVLSAFNTQLEMSVRQRTTELETAKSEIQREKDRAEALLADLNHRVGNSLQIVSSLLGMHGARIESPEAREILESVRGCVHAIASAQRRVRLSGSNDLVEVNHFLDNLLQDLRSALGGDDRVTISLTADEVVAPSHDAVSMGVIVTEAINNAIKHAGKGPVEIKVTLAGDRDKKPLLLTVEDDGAGFDESSGNKGGLGSQITEALSASLRASVRRDHVQPSGPRRGTRIQLDFGKDALAA
jgi:two-component sensor histidine kinase/CHASE3 domain sensor protein